MKQKFLKDLGIDMDEATEDLLNQFNLNGFMDQISDNRLKEEKEKFEELTNIKEDNKEENKEEKKED